MDKKRSFFNLEVTYNQAVGQLAGLDPALAARRARVSFDRGSSSFKLPFIKNEYRVSFPGGKVYHEDGRETSLYLSTIMLHYLARADGSPLTGEWVSFRHLPGGDIYMEPFRRRAVIPFLKTFEQKPGQFKRAAEALGGYPGPSGGVSMVIPVMPLVPLCFILWPGDDELPASANILFDSRAEAYLPTEDYAHLPAIITGEMKAHI